MGSFTTLLASELWRRALEAAGFKVLTDPWPPRNSETARLATGVHS